MAPKKAMTEFQKRIVDYLSSDRPPNHAANRWEIAQIVFKEKWKNPSGRGALVGHITRAAKKMPEQIGIRWAKDRWGDQTLFLRR